MINDFECSFAKYPYIFSIPPDFNEDVKSFAAAVTYCQVTYYDIGTIYGPLQINYIIEYVNRSH